MQKHVTRVAEGRVAGEAWGDMYGAVRKAKGYNWEDNSPGTVL